MRIGEKLRALEGARVVLNLGSGRSKQSADKVLAEINGMNHYLVKPCDPNSLIALLAPLKKP